MQIQQTLLSGIYTAQQRFVRSAENLAQAVTPVTPVQEQDQQPASKIQPVTAVPEIGTQSTAYAASDIGLIESSVDMIASANAYKANLKTFKAWNETVQSTLSDLTA